MANAAEQEVNSVINAEKNNLSGGGGNSKKLIIFLLMAVIVILAGVAGGLAMNMGKSEAAAASQPAEQAAEAPAEAPKESKEGHGGEAKAEVSLKPGEYQYYELDPIIVNLDEPRLARYVRASIVLAVKNEDYKNASTILDKKKPEMKSWLTVYLAGCTLEDVRGPKNLNRIRREIQAAVNDQLWPDGKGLVDKVLFKEFAVQ